MMQMKGAIKKAGEKEETSEYNSFADSHSWQYTCTERYLK